VAKKTFQCRVITPEAKVIDGPATSAVIPLWDGQMGVLPNRAPIVTKLGVGELRLELPDQPERKVAGGSRSFVVEGGFAHMVHNTLTILASKATPAEMINETDALAELHEAEARKTEGVTDPAQLERIRADRNRARLKLHAAKSLKARGI
jgi:F-type H+-transporting ATPase subunit epsilon